VWPPERFATLSPCARGRVFNVAKLGNKVEVETQARPRGRMAAFSC